MAQDTFSARAVAVDASKMLGRTVSPKQVRALARGDSGAAVVKRLDDEGYSAHVYSAAERRSLLEAFAKREGKRTGKTPTVPGVKATTTARKTRGEAREAKGTPTEAPSAE